MRGNSVMERWIGSCRRELLNRTLIWNQRHQMGVLREYEDFYNTHRPHRTLNQAAPLRLLPDGVTDLDRFRIRRLDRAGGVIHEYHLVAVGCQKSACPVTCDDGRVQSYGIMVTRVPAPALSHVRPGLRLAGPARPVIGFQGR
jgi:hypothetical protein